MTAPVPRQLFPVVVGVSGHIDIVAATEAPVRTAVIRVLTELHGVYGPALHVLTGLAEGADQLVAQEAGGLGIRIVAALPMPMERYAPTLPSDAGRTILAECWAKADLQLQLPEICDPAAPDYDELHYEQLAVLLARRSHLLLVLWNGEAPAPAARGGTADVIAMRAGGSHHRRAARQSPWFRDSFTRFDLSRGGAVLQIVTPRVKNSGAVTVAGRSVPEAGAAFLLSTSPRDVGQDGVLAALEEDDRQNFQALATLNKQIAGFHAYDAAVFARQIGYLTPGDVAGPGGKAGACLDQLRAWQAAPDTAAQRFQRRLLGQFAPAAGWRGAVRNGWNVLAMNWNRHRPPGMRWWRIIFPRMGVIFAFTALVPLAVLLFETHIGLDHNPYFLVAYFLLFVWAVLHYRRRVLPEQWQDRFQDYRALAEAMRVQMFWGLAALPDGVADYTLRQQRGELGWINFVLRGPALWSAALAQSLPGPHRALVTKCWIADQHRYFVGDTDKPGAAQKNAEFAHRNDKWSGRFLFLGLATAMVMLPIEVVRMKWQPDPMPHGVWHWVKVGLEVLTVIAALAPALSAFFVLSSELRAYAAHSHSYEMMGQLFAHALHAEQGSDAEFQGLVHELGLEALSESAEWLLDHRQRKIDPKAG